jgi:hypothetical protein
LEEIRYNLVARIAEAEREGWLGKAEDCAGNRVAYAPRRVQLGAGIGIGRHGGCDLHARILVANSADVCELRHAPPQSLTHAAAAVTRLSDHDVIRDRWYASLNMKTAVRDDHDCDVRMDPHGLESSSLHRDPAQPPEQIAHYAVNGQALCGILFIPHVGTQWKYPLQEPASAPA